MFSRSSLWLARCVAELRDALEPVLDVVEGRVEDASPPAWCERRGWTSFLLALDHRELARCEAEGLAAWLPTTAGAPADLVDLAAAVRAHASVPRADLAFAEALPAGAERGVRARKRGQLVSLLATVKAMAERAARIVDVGSGAGHFTRLAGTRYGREALGIERDRARVAAAQARAGEDARYLALDACREELTLAPDDLAVGLHACGELGETLARSAAAAGCDLVLVSCCPQKIHGDAWRASSRAGQGLTVQREHLGLANLTPSAVSVEGDRDVAASREVRLGLRSLLRERGVALEAGEEMRGINRRRARRGLAAVASQALAARGLPAASEREIERHAEDARRAYGAIRRLSLPRNMVGRLLELFIVSDRASLLEEAGHAVLVATLFPAEVTPRNLAIFASRSADRLPVVWR